MSESWVPLHIHTHFSVLESPTKPEDFVKRVTDKGYNVCGIADSNSISGIVEVLQAAKKKLRVLTGCELRICQAETDKTTSVVFLLAKNKNGYKRICRLLTATQSSKHERITVEDLTKFADDVLVLDGNRGSLFETIWRDDGEEALRRHVAWMKEIFGDDYILEVFLADGLKTSRDVAEQVRKLSGMFCVRKIAACNSYYTDSSLADDQRVLICIKHKTDLKRYSSELSERNVEFFKSTGYDIPTKERMDELHLGFSDELNIQDVIDKIEPFDILSSPKTPNFPCPNGKSEKDYLVELCREGWKNKCKHIPKEMHAEYGQRMLKEMKVFAEANLEGYFLIVQDYVNWAKSKGILVGPGRGSAAGSLAAYLLGITEIDPIPYKLMFERFYNAGRNTATHVSMPDIDMDFPAYQKADVIQYIIDKYGVEHAGRICTWGTLQAKSVMTDVLRINGIDFATSKNISKLIPNKLQIDESMLEQKETSVLMWTLKNQPRVMHEWCRIEDGKLIGEFAKYFEQCIRLEGTIRNISEHAAGVVITSEPINDICPMIVNKDGHMNTAFDMGAVEAVGGIKFDILAVESLDVLQEYNRIIESMSNAS